MEHASKRRRVTREGGRSDGIGIRLSKGENTTASNDNMATVGHYRSNKPLLGVEARAGERDRSKASSIPSKTFEQPLEASIPSQSTYLRLHPRDIVPSRVEHHIEAEETVVSSIIQVIIDDGPSTFAEVTLPSGPTVVSLSEYGPFTIIPAQLSSSYPQPTTPGVPAYPSATTAQATPGPQTATKASSSSTTTAAPSSESQNSAPQPSPSSLSINVSGSSSQAVLSSPPSTPLPSSSSMSLPTWSSSMTSYFNTPPTPSSAPSLTETLPPPPATSANSQPTNVQVFSYLPASGNFSLTTITHSRTSASLTETSSLDYGTFKSNSTQSATSTTLKSSSSFLPIITTSSFSSRSSQSVTAHSTTSTSQFTSSHTTQTPSTSSQPSVASNSSTTALSSSLSSSPSTTLPGAGGAQNPSGSSSSSAAPSSTAGSGTGTGGSNTTSTPAVVGGVVGGVAGLAIILIVLLFLYRWRRKRIQNRQISGAGAGAGIMPPGSAQSGGAMTARSSAVPLTAAAFFKRFRPHSGQTTAATTETSPSEVGFQNLGGRKIESVLLSGGDGYGGSIPGAPGPSAPGPSNRETRAGTSFYRDSEGSYGGAASNPASMYVGPGSPQPASPTYASPAGSGVPPGLHPEDAAAGGRSREVAIMRPGPARTPVQSQAGFSPFSGPRPVPPRSMGTPPPPPRATPSPGPGYSTDGVGRSHPSFDGSRGSRFHEDVG